MQRKIKFFELVVTNMEMGAEYSSRELAEINNVKYADGSLDTVSIASAMQNAMRHGYVKKIGGGKNTRNSVRYIKIKTIKECA